LEFLDQRLKDVEKNLPQDQRRPMGLLDTLRFVADNDFERITYTEAVQILRNSKPYKKGKFQYPVEWGKDLQAEHERYLGRETFPKARHRAGLSLPPSKHFTCASTTGPKGCRATR
jgi:asparaginyl-tRNA synthetase